MPGLLDDFDDTIHAPRRLAICAFLAAVDSAEFATLKSALEISDSSLSKQLSMLADAGYIRTEKLVSGGRGRLWVALTPTGRSAFTAHVRRLRELLDLGSS
jgi:DNA-binding MarR family transcriptional regulator